MPTTPVCTDTNCPLFPSAPIPIRTHSCQIRPGRPGPELDRRITLPYQHLPRIGPSTSIFGSRAISTDSPLVLPQVELAECTQIPTFKHILRSSHPRQSADPKVPPPLPSRNVTRALAAVLEGSSPSHIQNQSQRCLEYGYPLFVKMKHGVLHFLPPQLTADDYVGFNFDPRETATGTSPCISSTACLRSCQTSDFRFSATFLKLGRNDEKMVDALNTRRPGMTPEIAVHSANTVT